MRIIFSSLLRALGLVEIKIGWDRRIGWGSECPNQEQQIGCQRGSGVFGLQVEFCDTENHK